MKKNHIVLAIFGCIIASLMCMIDANARKAEKLEKQLDSKEFYYEIGNDLENWVFDVIYETDLMDDITEDEKKYLDELWDEENYSRYYIELVILYGKYYKE